MVKSIANQIAFDDLGADKVNGSGKKDSASSENRLYGIHRWVPWIAGFSAAFVNDVLDNFLFSKRYNHRPLVLDPFCGVGTTLIESMDRGVDSVGFEINPYAALASRVKSNAPRLDLSALSSLIVDYGEFIRNFQAEVTNSASPRIAMLRSLPPTKFKSRIPFFSESVLWQVRATMDYLACIEDEPLRELFLVAFGSVMIRFSNYSYEPSLSTRPGSGKPLVEYAAVGDIVLDRLCQMLEDATSAKQRRESLDDIPQVTIYQDSFFNVRNFIEQDSVDLVVTSPPYLNNYHYVRNTRPHLWWLGLIDQTAQLREMEEQSLGKFWQTVRDREPIPLRVDLPALDLVLEAVRQRNPQRGAYGGPGWANYVVTYFNDLVTFGHLLSQILKPGAHAVVVVGNSIIQGVEIKVDELLSDIAGYYDLVTEGIEIIRDKRVGSSIVDSSIRTQGSRKKVVLYDAAVALRKDVSHRSGPTPMPP